MKTNNQRWREFERGDLVQVGSVIKLVNQKITFNPTAVVLESFDSNVYEPASCSVLVEGEVMHISSRQLTMIKEGAPR